VKGNEGAGGGEMKIRKDLKFYVRKEGNLKRE